MKNLNHNHSINIVIGLGVSGIAAARFLKSKGQNVLVFEKAQQSSYKELAKKIKEEGINVQLGTPLEFSSFEPWLKNISSVILSPGIAWDHPTLNQLRERGILVEAEISLAWKGLRNIPWIGITGTNGKTTVTHMLNHVLNENLIYSEIGGNIGKAATEIALKVLESPKRKPKWLAIELSSYQIESAPEISPHIGIWTTFTPDHLERHGSMKNYFKIKRKLIENSSIRIYNADDVFLNNNRTKLPIGLWVSSKAADSDSHLCDFWISAEGIVTQQGKELFDSSVLKLKGDHNLQNLLLVTAAARAVGLSSKQIKDAIGNFQGIPHRFEHFGQLRNIEIINDSKATNFDSSAIALAATNGKTILIAGGQIKQGNSQSWLKNINEKAYGVVLFGEGHENLKLLINKSGFKGYLRSYSNLSEAVNESIKLTNDWETGTILFSPGCASFDQYKNFEARGNHFKNLIKKFLI